MRLAIVVAFLNEERYLPRFLESIAGQTRPADRLLLVDDGSTDGSPEIVERFAAEHDYARVLRRPPRPPQADRLVQAHELQAFQWGAGQLDGSYDVVTKMDADLELTPRTFETILAAFESDPKLGMAGAYLSAVHPDGTVERERCPADHVRGPTKFYRRECFDQIQPVPAILGWDTIDEIKARMHGWKTRALAMPDGDPLHLRPVGSQDGRLRGYRRWGRCAYAYGAHPLYVVLGGVSRLKERPRVAGGVNYVAGYALSAARRVPRAEPEVRKFVQAEQKRKMRTLDRNG